MPRIRTVKPDFWTDEKIGRLKREERLLFIGLWNLADDQGVIKNSSVYIKGQLFSYDDDLRTLTIDAWLASLITARMLVPFRFEAESYLCIRTFDEHQLINRPSKAKFSKELLVKIKNTHGVLSEYSQPEGKGKEGKGEDDTRPGLVKKNDLGESNLFRKPNVPEKNDVLRVFLQHGGTKEMAKKFYNANEATGWFNRGSPIVNFANMVPSFVENWEKNLNNKNGNFKSESSTPALKDIHDVD